MEIHWSNATTLSRKGKINSCWTSLWIRWLTWKSSTSTWASFVFVLLLLDWWCGTKISRPTFHFDNVARRRRYWLTGVPRQPSSHDIRHWPWEASKGSRKADVSKRLTPSMGWHLHKLTRWELEGYYKPTVLINICLPPTYHVYKEITCSPCFVQSEGILIRKGSRKVRFKEIPKRKRLLIWLGDVHALLL